MMRWLVDRHNQAHLHCKQWQIVLSIFSHCVSLDLPATYVFFYLSQLMAGSGSKICIRMIKHKGLKIYKQKKQGKKSDFEVRLPGSRCSPIKQKKPGRMECWFLVSRYSHRALQAHGPCLRSPPFFSGLFTLGGKL